MPVYMQLEWKLVNSNSKHLSSKQVYHDNCVLETITDVKYIINDVIELQSVRAASRSEIELTGYYCKGM